MITWASLGCRSSTTRQILSGGGKIYRPSDIVGKHVIVAANIDAKTMADIDSYGMLIGIEHDHDGRPRLIFTDDDLPAGTLIS